MSDVSIQWDPIGDFVKDSISDMLMAILPWFLLGLGIFLLIISVIPLPVRIFIAVVLIIISVLMLLGFVVV